MFWTKQTWLACATPHPEFKPNPTPLGWTVTSPGLISFTFTCALVAEWEKSASQRSGTCPNCHIGLRGLSLDVCIVFGPCNPTSNKCYLHPSSNKSNREQRAPYLQQPTSCFICDKPIRRAENRVQSRVKGIFQGWERKKQTFRNAFSQKISADSTTNTK